MAWVVVGGVLLNYANFDLASLSLALIVLNAPPVAIASTEGYGGPEAVRSGHTLPVLTSPGTAFA